MSNSFQILRPINEYGEYKSYFIILGERNVIFFLYYQIKFYPKLSLENLTSVNILGSSPDSKAKTSSFTLSRTLRDSPLIFGPDWSLLIGSLSKTIESFEGRQLCRFLKFAS